MSQKVKKHQLCDFFILVPYLILSIFGLIMVYSSTSYKLLSQNKNPSDDAIKQMFFWIISLVIMIIIYKMKTKFLKNNLLVNFIMLTINILMLFTFFFKKVNNAYGWIQLPGIGTLQPVEFLKIGILWFLVIKIAKFKDFKSKITFFPLITIVCDIVIMMLYPDFGNASVVVLLLLVVFLSSGINYIYTILVGIIVFLGSIWTIHLVNIFGKLFLPPHVVSRFAVYKNPFLDEFGSGHQLINGYYAIFNGGFFGRGIGNSIQKKGFLKFAHTDFAFTIVAEEMGLIISIFILLLFFFMISRILLVGIRSNDCFNSMMLIGIASLFLISIFINLGGITGLIPLTGITFPFISQGGSSLLTLSIAVGFSLNISADEKKQTIMKSLHY